MKCFFMAIVCMARSPPLAYVSILPCIDEARERPVVRRRTTNRGIIEAVHELLQQTNKAARGVLPSFARSGTVEMGADPQRWRLFLT